MFCIYFRIYTKSGTAKSPQDFTKVDKVVSFKPNKNVELVEIPLNNDCYPEGKEFFEVFLKKSGDPRVDKIDEEPTKIKIEDDDGKRLFSKNRFLLTTFPSLYDRNCVVIKQDRETS